MYTCTFIYRYKYWIEVIYVNGYLLCFALYPLVFRFVFFFVSEWLNLWGEWCVFFVFVACSYYRYGVSQSIIIYVPGISLSANENVAGCYAKQKAPTKNAMMKCENKNRSTTKRQSERNSACECVWNSQCAVPLNKYVWRHYLNAKPL